MEEEVPTAGLLSDKRGQEMSLLSLSPTTQIRRSESVWPTASSLLEISALTLLVLFLEQRIRDKANPLRARSAHKLWGDENILKQNQRISSTKNCSKNVVFCLFFFFASVFLLLFVPLIFGAEKTPRGIYNKWNI